MLQRQILGACLQDKKALDIAINKLTPTDFTGENQDIFRLISDMASTGDIDQFKVAKEYGDQRVIFAIASEVETTKLIKSQCETLKETATKEKLKAEMYEMIMDNNSTVDEIKKRLDTMCHGIEINDVQSEIRDLDAKPYEGVVTVQNKFIPTGMPSIDFALNDLVGGMTTLVAGRQNGGKTTFCNQVIANAIDKGYKVLVVNGEEKQEVTINKLYTAAVGRSEEFYNSIKVNKRYKKEPNKQALKALSKWHSGKLKIFSKGESNLKTTDQLFNLVKREVKKTNTDLVVMDNLMSLLTVTSDLEKNGKQAEFMQKCCDLAKERNVHIMVVLHPNKTYRKGEEMEVEQIAGTSDLGNKADNVITVIREYDENLVNSGLCGYIKVQKNRDFSDLPKVDVHFEKTTGLLLEIIDNQYKAYNFKWQQYL